MNDKNTFVCSLVAEAEAQAEQESQRANKHYEVTRADRERVTKRLYYGLGKANYNPETSPKVTKQERTAEYFKGCY